MIKLRDTVSDFQYDEIFVLLKVISFFQYQITCNKYYYEVCGFEVICVGFGRVCPCHSTLVSTNLEVPITHTHRH